MLAMPTQVGFASRAWPCGRLAPGERPSVVSLLAMLAIENKQPTLPTKNRQFRQTRVYPYVCWQCWLCQHELKSARALRGRACSTRHILHCITIVLHIYNFHVLIFDSQHSQQIAQSLIPCGFQRWQFTPTPTPTIRQHCQQPANVACATKSLTKTG